MGKIHLQRYTLGFFFAVLFLTLCPASYASGNRGGTSAGTVTIPTNVCVVGTPTTGDAYNACPAAVVYNTNNVVTTATGSSTVLVAGRSDNGLAISPIDAWGICRYVDNDLNKSVFVPFKTAAEWSAFVANKPANIDLTDCARAANLTIPPDSIATDQLYCNSATAVATAGSPLVSLNYARAGSAALTGYSVTYNCGAFTETAVATFTPLSSTRVGSTPTSVSDPSASESIVAFATSSGSDSNLNNIDWLETVVYTAHISGQCGAANNTAVSSKPTTGLCSAGTASSITGTGPWDWTCTAATSVGCSAPTDEVTGTCGHANGNISATAPTSGLCSTGTASVVGGSASTSWTWSCTGSDGGVTATCTAPAGVDGACGPTSGTNVSSVPGGSSGLCSSGTASAVTGSNPWDWTCAGTGSGTTASCSAGYGNSCSVASATCAAPPAAPVAPGGAPVVLDITKQSGTVYNEPAGAYIQVTGAASSGVTINGGSYVVVNAPGSDLVINPSSNAYVEIDGDKYAGLIVNNGAYILLNTNYSNFNVFANTTATAVINGSYNTLGNYTVSAPIYFSISYAQNVYVMGTNNDLNISDSKVSNPAVFQSCGCLNNIWMEDTEGTLTYTALGDSNNLAVLMGNSTGSVTGNKNNFFVLPGSAGDTVSYNGALGNFYLESSNSTGTMTGSSSGFYVENSSVLNVNGNSMSGDVVLHSLGNLNGNNDFATYYDSSAVTIGSGTTGTSSSNGGATDPATPTMNPN